MQALDAMTLKRRRDILLSSQKVPLTLLEDMMFVYRGPYRFNRDPLANQYPAFQFEEMMGDAAMEDAGAAMDDPTISGQKRKEPPEFRAGDELNFDRFYGDADYNRRRPNSPPRGEKRREHPDFMPGDQPNNFRYHGDSDYNRRRIISNKRERDEEFEGSKRAKSTNHPSHSL
jgi:ribosomal protein L19